MRIISIKILRISFHAYLLFAICYMLAGCATLPTGAMLPTYSINGVSYVSLADVCAAKNISLDYDVFTCTAVLRKDTHKINLMAGDALVLLDGEPTRLKYPVSLYKGMIVVPSRFKEQVIDELFKEYRAKKETILPLRGIKRIVIDAGHGGNDPGAIGRSGLREKDVVLDIARRLSSILKSSGAEVTLTRSSDKFVSLEGRTNIANNYKADLFISIHANANRVRSLNGFEIYYVANSVDDYRRALWAAQHARLNFDSSCFASNSLTLKTILWDMIYTSSRGQSVELANSICRTVDRNLDAKILGIKGGRYYVLKGTRMPAILIEVGFLSNSSEERLLKNSSYRQSIAEAIAEGVKNYTYE
ncbi:MAG: N-acetylmuramoyl-L-alanine amidase [Candidatus Omnitrophota bacterium]